MATVHFYIKDIVTDDYDSIGLINEQGTVVFVIAPAKINLFLHIVGRDEIGYHLLQSLFCKLSVASVYDSIKITLRDDGVVSCDMSYDGISLGVEDFHVKCADNIALKAAKKLRNEYGSINMGAHIAIHKRIPIAAGLGGGSSNAASILLALRSIWSIDISDEELKKCGLSLGADIPFFLQKSRSGAAFVEGIGEIITPMATELFDRVDRYILLVNPKITLNTGECYSGYHGNFRGSLWHDKECEEKDRNMDRAVSSIKTGHNDLFDSACKSEPVIGNVIALLEAQKGCSVARMSGSGATCFGLFSNRDDIMAAYQFIITQKPNWWLHKGELGFAL